MTREEAPEKIYIQSFNVSEEDAKFERLLCFDDIWTEEPEPNQENIEYVRIDAFIEKAVLYLIHNTSVVHYPFGDIREFKNNFDEMLKDFRNYMKGK